MTETLQSWNRVPRVVHARTVDMPHRLAPFPELAGSETFIPYGNGRSYGDVCLNGGGVAIKTRAMDHFIAFDRASGRLLCEGGVLLAEILDLVVPQGWFLPVSPGTRLATVGGAIANDVHGKNHHVSGSFGHHVLRFELLRSDGRRLSCSQHENVDWFHATIGGLGLTGLIAFAELQLAPVANAFMITKGQKFRNLEEFWTLNETAERDWPYTVAWVDCTGPQGRGVLFCGRHAPPRDDLPAFAARSRRFPVETPFSLINAPSLRSFNFAYYRRPLPAREKVSHYIPYFYPLDSIRDWNRIYGTRGFYQYQCVIPREHAREGVGQLLGMVSRSGSGSFLSVLKTFGAKPSLGMLSFPRPGATLALDFPNAGASTLRLLDRLDGVVREFGGALYPAKDARMSADMFRSGFPRFEKFTSFVDPRASSGFWRRVTET